MATFSSIIVDNLKYDTSTATNSSKTYHSESSTVDEKTSENSKHQQWMKFVSRRVGVLGEMVRGRGTFSTPVTTGDQMSNDVIDIVGFAGR